MWSKYSSRRERDRIESFYRGQLRRERRERMRTVMAVLGSLVTAIVAIAVYGAIVARLVSRLFL